jgi:RNA polymerase sigma factor (sigma-70 family)
VRSDTPRGAERAFPPTRRSVVERLAAREPGERRDALGELVAAYWRPVYAYLRLRRGRPREDAQDLTQAFFAAALEKGLLAGFEPSPARFRTFLRTCLDRFASSADRARDALKRGGGVERVDLDFDAAEGDLAGRPASELAAEPDPWFEAEYRRALLEAAVAELRRECAERGHALRFELFRRYDLEADRRPTYDELAREHGLEAHAVTNALHAARRDFRRIVLERLRAWTRDEDEFQDELRALFGGGSAR